MTNIFTAKNASSTNLHLRSCPPSSRTIFKFLSHDVTFTPPIIEYYASRRGQLQAIVRLQDTKSFNKSDSKNRVTSAISSMMQT